MPEAGVTMRVLTKGATPNADVNARVIGFDFGLKRIGVATGNTRTGTSQGLSTVPAKAGTPDWFAVGRLIEEWLPAALIVGLPLNMDGSESSMAARARKFGERAGRRFGLSVVYVDERLTTAGAEELLAAARTNTPGKSLRQRRIKHRDNLAAELIVRTWLEDNRN